MAYVDIVQLEALTGIKRRTLRKWTKPGQEVIPCYRIGKLVRFNPEEIEQWLSSKKVVPVDPNAYDSRSVFKA